MSKTEEIFNKAKVLAMMAFYIGGAIIVCAFEQVKKIFKEDVER